MSSPADALPAAPSLRFPELLRDWRRRRRLSQLDLALSAGISQRHLSFLESGRAQPSRGMVLQLSETLAVPLRERNGWLLAAGFAPVFHARPLDDPQMQQVLAAVRLMLANHEPFPALALDREWNVRLANESFERLAAALGPSLWPGAGRNLLRLFFHPSGLKPYVTNWHTIAPLLWYRARREAEAASAAGLQQILAELAPYQDFASSPTPDPVLLPVLPVEIEKDGLRLSLFTVISVFGTPQDVTADELRIESMFPADDATAQFLRAAARH